MFKVFSKFRAQIAIALVLAISGQFAAAWGLSTQVESSIYRQYLLAAKTLKNKRLFYCVELSPDFESHRKSIEAQTEAAVVAWWTPVKDKISPDSIVDVAKCGDRKVDLKVVVGHFGVNGDVHIAGARNDDRTYSLPIEIVEINLDYPFDYLGQIVFASDFSDIVGRTHRELNSFLDQFILRQDYYLTEFAAQYHLDPAPIEASTWSILLHEIGHTFGLCHTYSMKSCSDRYRLQLPESSQPESIMKQGGFVSLASDDIEAINNLFDYLLNIKAVSK